MTANSNDALATAGEQAFAREYFRNLVFQELLIAFKASGLTRASLARRVSKKPEQITRWFSAPGNLEVDTISDLLMAMGTRPESILRARTHTPASARVAELIAKTSSQIQSAPTIQLSTALKDAFFTKPTGAPTGSSGLSHPPSNSRCISLGRAGEVTNAPGVITQSHAPKHRLLPTNNVSAV